MNELLPLFICAGVIAIILIVLIGMLTSNICKTRKAKRRKKAFRQAKIREMKTSFVERYRYKNQLYFVYQNDDGRIVVLVKPEQYGLNDEREGMLLYKEFEGKNYFVDYKLGRFKYKVSQSTSDELRDLITSIMGED